MFDDISGIPKGFSLGRNVKISVVPHPIGALSATIPTVDGMRPFMDILDKIPHELTGDERYVYRAVGILYEAVKAELKKREG